MGPKSIAFLRDLLKQLAGQCRPSVQVQIQAAGIAGTLLPSSMGCVGRTALSHLQQLIELAMAQRIGDERWVVSRHERLIRHGMTLWRTSELHQFG